MPRSMGSSLRYGDRADSWGSEAAEKGSRQKSGRERQMEAEREGGKRAARHKRCSNVAYPWIGVEPGSAPGSALVKHTPLVKRWIGVETFADSYRAQTPARWIKVGYEGGHRPRRYLGSFRLFNVGGVQACLRYFAQLVYSEGMKESKHEFSFDLHSVCLLKCSNQQADVAKDLSKALRLQERFDSIEIPALRPNPGRKDNATAAAASGSQYMRSDGKGTYGTTHKG